MRSLTRLIAAWFLTVAALAGCTDDADSDRAPVKPSGTDELAAHDGEVCPFELAEPTVGEHGFGTEEPATASPEFPEVDQAWVCRFDAVETARDDNGAIFTWLRVGSGATEIAASELSPIEHGLRDLRPEEVDACTADLGPRWMLVLATTKGDLTGVVMDDYGCDSIRLTVDPFQVAPGDEAPGTVSGVLEGPSGFVKVIASHWIPVGLCDRSCQRRSLSEDEFEWALAAARWEQERIKGTFVGATAFAVNHRVPPFDEGDACPNSRLLILRLVWKADANFVHSGPPGQAHPDGPRKAQLLALDVEKGTLCERAARYRQVGADPSETLLYGRRP